MKRESRASLVVTIVLLLPALYVGSYLALVEPNPKGIPYWGLNSGSGHYGYRGALVDRFFWPLEQVDRMVRPKAWPNETEVQQIY
ncbi:hypothetical protein [Anatilimnocola floriformis]|uniref:hypothetical protein n=1 Tax=Anatilimnocola floriformis TaxID=2948575 RepID=UPI0020C3ACA4|nr:hypothetical protein [Anatilimnocola floriformis]